MRRERPEAVLRLPAPADPREARRLGLDQAGIELLKLAPARALAVGHQQAWVSVLASPDSLPPLVQPIACGTVVAADSSASREVVDGGHLGGSTPQTTYGRSAGPC